MEDVREVRRRATSLATNIKVGLDSIQQQQRRRSDSIQQQKQQQQRKTTHRIELTLKFAN